MSHLSYNDEWFNQKLKSEFQSIIPEDNLSRQIYLRKAQYNIMSTVVAHQSTGIGHCQLAHEVRINRKNLTAHMQRLISKELVKRGKGKQGKYYPTTKGNRGIYRSAHIIGKGAAECMLADSDDEDWEFPVESPFLSTEFSGYQLPDVLSKFSNKIGVIITYLIIQAMDPTYMDSSTKLESSNDIDLEVERWFDDAICALRPILIPFLWSLVTTNLRYVGYTCKEYVNPAKTKGKNRSTDRQSGKPNLLDDTAVSVLTDLLRELYPRIIGNLEKCKSQLPKTIAEQLRWSKYVSYRNTQQQKCIHDYALPSNKILSEKSGNRIQHCRKCHKTKYHSSLFLK